MKSFFFKLSCLTAIVIPTAVVLVLLTFTCMKGVFVDSYQRGQVFQEDALRRADPNKPKIVILGTSFLPFGIRPKLIREQTGMPVYTLGVNGGLGWCWLIELVETFVEKGDVVVIPYQRFEKNDYGMPLVYVTYGDNPRALWNFFRKHPWDVMSSICPGASRIWVTTLAPFLKFVKGTPQKTCYHVDSFDKETGDFIYPCKDCWPADRSFGKTRFIVDEGDYSLWRLNELAEFCKGKGAKLCLTFPPHMKAAVLSSEQELDHYVQVIRESVKAPIISDPREEFVDRQYIYNGITHLNDAGALWYTQKLIEDVHKSGVLTFRQREN